MERLIHGFRYRTPDEQRPEENVIQLNPSHRGQPPKYGPLRGRRERLDGRGLAEDIISFVVRTANLI